MSTKHPRVNVVLEEPVYKAVKQISRQYKISMSMVIRDMVKEEIEKYEDGYLAAIAGERDKTSKGSKNIKHKDFWKNV